MNRPGNDRFAHTWSSARRWCNLFIFPLTLFTFRLQNYHCFSRLVAWAGAVAVEEGRVELKLRRDYSVVVEMTIAPSGYAWWVVNN